MSGQQVILEVARPGNNMSVNKRNERNIKAEKPGGGAEAI